MSRHEGELKAAGEVRIGIADLLGSAPATPSERARQDAIVCYLSGGEGWQDALRLLGGAFAPDPKGRETGLTMRKVD